jgi:sigma-54 dependent transcriptional regulator
VALREAATTRQYGDLVGSGASMREVFRRIEKVASTDISVLVTGETGTGKEIVARFLHDRSRRRERPFIAVNCGALPESLVESELFGHERGAFTGALSARPGWFEAADGGTLFLDEIGDLPPPAQVKLLRVLQEREVVRVGSRQPIPLDVRLVAATNVDLEQAVEEGRFRRDLYYRLHVASLRILPLRERPGDVVPLARHFLDEHAQRLGRGPVTLDAMARERLVDHRWPGNIRELENVIQHALLVSSGDCITAADLRLPTARSQPAPASAPPTPFAELDAALAGLFARDVPSLHAVIEERLFRAAYAYAEQNQLQTARLLGISRNVVRARLLAYGLLAGTPRAARAAELTPPAFPGTLRPPLPRTDP